MDTTYLESLIDRIEAAAGCPVAIGPLRVDSKVSFVVAAGNFTDRTLDADKTKVFSFQILTKDKGQLQAFERCGKVVEALDGLNNISLGNHHLIKSECTTTTNFVEKDSDNQYIYTALFKAELQGEN